MIQSTDHFDYQFNQFYSFFISSNAGRKVKLAHIVWCTGVDWWVQSYLFHLIQG